MGERYPNWPTLSFSNLVSGTFSVPISIIEDPDVGELVPYTIIAGQVAMSVESGNTLVPRSEWCLSKDPPLKDTEENKDYP
ncbi:MAG: hypothetical protein V2I33_22625 [Kangiellaceae bacterium]|jgi:hypothetical protein|nr:hypothetical protein [Kangiellaceae bacterium]